MTITDQYLRAYSITVVGAIDGLDLSDLRFRFHVEQSDIQTPNHTLITIYNLSDATAQKVQEEGARVILQAGYRAGNFGTIFDGQIKQVRRGRENQTDTYLDILAADGDEAYNLGVVNASIAAGSTTIDAVNTLASAMALPAPELGGIDLTGTQYARGKVLYGMARDQMRNIAASTLSTWSIQNGRLQMIPEAGYLPGSAVVLTARTGMIGLPEQTQDGIKIRCLLNPRIKIGTAVQIDNRSIQRALGQGGINLNLDRANFQSFVNQTLPTISNDGFYQVIVVEHVGDTRGQEWYSTLTCLAINRTVPAAGSVQIDG